MKYERVTLTSGMHVHFRYSIHGILTLLKFLSIEQFYQETDWSLQKLLGFCKLDVYDLGKKFEI